MNKLGERIKIIRENNDLLQRDFAELLDVDQGTVSNWEKGRRIPSIEKLQEIAIQFNITLDELLNTNILPKPIRKKNKPLDKTEEIILSKIRLLNTKNQQKVIGYIENCLELQEEESNKNDRRKA